MDESRDQPAAPERAPLVAANSHLTPTQEAYSAWARHRLRCATCRDVDAGRCDTAEQLHRVFEELAGRALQRVVDG